MKVKTIFLLLQGYKPALVAAFFALLIHSQAAKHDIAHQVVEPSLIVAAVILLLLRLVLAPWALRRSHDPDLLYAVLEKLDRRSLWFAPKRPPVPYKPMLPMGEFLADNHLPTDFWYDRDFAKYVLGFMSIVVATICGFVIYAKKSVRVVWSVIKKAGPCTDRLEWLWAARGRVSTRISLRGLAT